MEGRASHCFWWQRLKHINPRHKTSKQQLIQRKNIYLMNQQHSFSQPLALTASHWDAVASKNPLNLHYSNKNLPPGGTLHCIETNSLKTLKAVVVTVLWYLDIQMGSWCKVQAAGFCKEKLCSKALDLSLKTISVYWAIFANTQRNHNNVLTYSVSKSGVYPI